MTPSEEIVSELCKNTFLSFWSFPNPIGKKGKELCDLIVVCDPDIIIFSVKDISIKESGNLNVDIDRWIRKAIVSSVDQIYGAERIIGLKEEIYLSDKVTKIKLPEKGIRNVYRVAVAFGRGEIFPCKYGDFGKGFVHVFDEKSIQIVLKELDTITDFIDYLNAREEFSHSGVRHISFGEEDLLALYYEHGFSFSARTLLHISDGYWDNYSKSEEYINEKKENESSYIWDSIIETIHNSFHDGLTVHSSSREELELTVRHMNKENRFSRRQLSNCFKGVVGEDDGAKTPNSRIVKVQVDHSPVYVFFTKPFEEREERLKELQLRCLFAKQMNKDSTIFIGIATEKYRKNQGYSFDICYLHLPHWSDELEETVNQAREQSGMYKNPKHTRVSPDGEKHSI
jgi:hypothetical protein